MIINTETLKKAQATLYKSSLSFLYGGYCDSFALKAPSVSLSIIFIS